MSDFTLHSRLAADTIFVADLLLCRVLLMNDVRYPWLVLVPRIADAVEIFDLSVQDRATLVEEITEAARTLQQLSGAAKMNIGALGNLVPQLHIHIVARNAGDPAWPGPVWGHGPAVPYLPGARDIFLAKLVNAR
jgi:diadenosine tetraphosphate (Ap4A) HIT family hydrolase